MRGRNPIPFIDRATAIIERSKRDLKTGCIVRQTCLLKTGYSVVKVTPDGRKKMGTHRFIWTAFRGEIPAGVDVLHSCDNRACINIDHLELGNDVKNMRQMCARSRGKNSHGRHKLTVDKVLRLRKEWKNGNRDNVRLANKYKVSRYYINAVVARKYWGWVS